MNVYKVDSIGNTIKGNEYVGRGIIIGKTPNGQAVTAYFIMGRSENSRNRIFVENGDEITIHPFDVSKVKDPSLIIYSPIRKIGNSLIVTNGDQTDTIYNFIESGKSFEQALATRCFEPDAPNFTPRISGIINFGEQDFDYKLSILKSADSEGSCCNRYTFSYSAINGLGHFVHTYVCNGNPIPTFIGEPERVAIPDDIDEFTKDIWDNLDKENKISLYVRYIDPKSGKAQNRMININK